MYGRVQSVSRAMVLAIVESGYEIAASEYDVTARSTSAGVFVCDGSMCNDVTIGTIGDATMATVDDAMIGGATRGTAIFETIGLTTGATIVVIGDMTIGLAIVTIGLAIVTIGGTIGDDVTMVMMGDATIGGDITMGDAVRIVPTSRGSSGRVGSGKRVGSWVLIGLVHQAIDLVRGVAVLFGDQRYSLIKRGSLNRTEGDRRIVVWKYVIF